MPSSQTINHLEGLLEILNHDDIFKERADRFNAAFKISQRDDKALKEILVENTIKIFEKEEIVIFNPRENPDNNRDVDNMRWITLDSSDAKYGNLWIHRWLALYVLNVLDTKNNINKYVLSNFIKTSSNIIPYYLKRLVDLDFSYTNLSNANLSNANLSKANLIGATLTYANLTGAISLTPTSPMPPS